MDGDAPTSETIEPEEDLSFTNARAKIDMVMNILVMAHMNDVDPQDLLNTMVKDIPELGDSLLITPIPEGLVSPLKNSFTEKVDTEAAGQSLRTIPEAIARLEDVHKLLGRESSAHTHPKDLVAGKYAVIFPELQTAFKPVNGSQQDQVNAAMQTLVSNEDDGSMDYAVSQLPESIRKFVEGDEDIKAARAQRKVEKYDRREENLRSLIPELQQLSNEYGSHPETYGMNDDVAQLRRVEIERQSPNHSPVLVVGLGVGKSNHPDELWMPGTQLKIITRSGRERFGIKEEVYSADPQGWDSGTRTYSWGKGINTFSGQMEEVGEIDPNGYSWAATGEGIKDIAKTAYTQALHSTRELHSARKKDQLQSKALWVVGAGVVLAASLTAVVQMTDLDDKAQEWWKNNNPFDSSQASDDLDVEYGGEFDRGSIIETADGQVFTYDAPDSDFGETLDT